MKSVDVLIAARAKVAKHWHQGGMYFDTEDGEGSFCAAGALQYVHGFDGAQTPMRAIKGAIKYINAVLRKITPPGRRPRAHLGSGIAFHSITYWNDSEGRTQQEVLAVFDAAIKNAKRRHINGGRKKVAANISRFVAIRSS